MAALAAQGAPGSTRRSCSMQATTWPTFNGDYSGRRFSALTQITAANVKALSLAWMYNADERRRARSRSTPLQIDGVLYFSTPDHAYAVDARTGREMWHYTWPTNGGNHLGNRGMGALGETLYFETPDCNLVALNMKDGAKRWDKTICDMDQFYYASVAPVDHQEPRDCRRQRRRHGQSRAISRRTTRSTGEMQWRWYAVPQKKGDPGSETWPNEEVMKHGGGMTWQPVTYDPELN